MFKKALILLSLFSFTFRAESTLYLDRFLEENLHNNTFHLEQYIASVVGKDLQKETIECYHVIKEVELSERVVILEDLSRWKIGWWHRNTIKDWKKGNRLKIFFTTSSSNNIKLENIDVSSTAWGEIELGPQPTLSDYISALSNPHIDKEHKIILSNGCIFKGIKSNWKIRDAIFPFHSEDGTYDLWNLNQEELVRGWVLIGNDNYGSEENIISLEKRLNRRVLGQQEATQAVSSALLTYYAGLHDPQTPIGVFLFLGPTGVGKTELAKVLTEELYKRSDMLIRFDMSHFSEPHSLARLIGSPPGYVNHQEGGQLTEALKFKPRSIVLLDEMEKAHATVRKMFLPIFDEGYICDAKNHKVPCQNVVFIMTSNLCSNEIIKLVNKGYTSEDILTVIEPMIMQELTPELYNRVTPILFRPLTHELMMGLVDQMLSEVFQRLKKLKNIDVMVDISAKNYLVEKGFHPLLGARPLKKLIQKKILATLSYAIIHESIPNGSHIALSYNAQEDGWEVTWF